MQLPGITILANLAIVALTIVLTSCGGGSADPKQNTGSAPCTVSSVAATASPDTLPTGSTTTLVAKVIGTASCSGAVAWTVTPQGGDLTASGSTATFVANSPGNFTVTATSLANPAISGTVQIRVTAPVACGTPNGTVVTHIADIASSETWAGDGATHLVPTSINLKGSAVLTVQACAIVALGQSASITVRDAATLVSAGSSGTRFVSFRRADFNQAWGRLQNYEPTGKIDLRWTMLEGGGNNGGTNANATLLMIGEGYDLLPKPVLRVDHVTIDGSQGTGIYLDANAAFTADSQQLSIRSANDFAMRIDMMALGSVPTGTYTGNAIDEIFLEGPNQNVFADMTIHDRGIPVRIRAPSLQVGGLVNSVGVVTLTIEPGVKLKFQRLSPTGPGAFVKFGHGLSATEPTGVLRAIGTPTKPIIFTSGEPVPRPGDWAGLWIDVPTGSRLENVEISYAGAWNGLITTNCKPNNMPDYAALVVGSVDPNSVPTADLITNSSIRQSAGHGINAIWQTDSISRPDLTATIAFEGIALCRQTYNALTPPHFCPISLGCTAP